MDDSILFLILILLLLSLCLIFFVPFIYVFLKRDQSHSPLRGIGRTFQFISLSLTLLTQEKKLLVFPALSLLAISGTLVLLAFPIFFTGFFGTLVTAGPFLSLGMLFLLYLVCYFFVIFFNGALVASVCAKLEGRPVSVMEGISKAAKRIPRIFFWAAISATIGLVLNLLEERGGLPGQIAAGIFGSIWSLLTFFVVPVIIFEDLSVENSMTESIQIIRKAWGESFIGSFSLGILYGLGAAMIFILFLVLTNSAGVSFGAVLAICIALFTLLVIAVVTLQGTFTAVLYMYARNGTLPGEDSRELIGNAFVEDKRKERLRTGPGNI